MQKIFTAICSIFMIFTVNNREGIFKYLIFIELKIIRLPVISVIFSDNGLLTSLLFPDNLPNQFYT